MADMMDIILAKALSGNDSGGGTGEGDPALVRRVAALEEELDTLLDEEGKVKEDCLPELGGSGSDPRVDALLDENGNVLKEKLPLLELAEFVAGMVLDENGKIAADLLPEDWVNAKVEEYVGEALGGEY